MKLINKDALVAEIEKKINKEIQSCATDNCFGYSQGCVDSMRNVLSFINALEVKDPYEQCVQYDSIKAGIQAHAETYSFNIESLLFNQLTKEQQALWRKEIEQACISGGEAGVQLARDTRYKENIEVKELIAEQECVCNEALNRIIGGSWNLLCPVNKLGLKTDDKVKVIIEAQKGE